ncbi:plexin domain-containing protein 2 [Stigmatopora argus]
MKTLCVITGLLVVVQLPVDDATPTSAFDSRGLYGDPHRPDDPDADLLLEEGHDNSTQIVNTDHVYYVSKTVSPGEAGGADAWVDVERADRSRWKTWAFLSGTNGRAERVHLSFDFPFYGHTLTEVTVTSGGKYKFYLHGRSHPPHADRHAVHCPPHGQFRPRLLRQLFRLLLR